MSPACTRTEVDFLCVSHQRWRAILHESDRIKASNEQLSLLLLALGHDLRQDVHLLQASLRAQEQTSLRSFGQKDRTNSLIGQLKSTCERAVAMATLTGPAASLVKRGQVAIQPVLLEACKHWQAIAYSKGLLFRLRTPSLTVSTNAFWLRIIVSNLVGNAIQHTARGGVGVSVSGAHDQWELTVADSGCGLDSDPSRSSAGAGSRDSLEYRTSGLGFGLQIVRQATAMLGHTMSISSGPLGTIVRIVSTRDDVALLSEL